MEAEEAKKSIERQLKTSASKVCNWLILSDFVMGIVLSIVM